MKPFWKSKTIWGVVISAMPAILQAFGVYLPDAVINEAVVAIGSALAIYGRTKAVGGVTLTNSAVK